jgi:hypothetical protein
MKSVIPHAVRAAIVNAHKMHELPIMQVHDFMDAIEAAVLKHQPSPELRAEIADRLLIEGERE